MIEISRLALPPISRGVALTVTIPARNEEADIESTVRALAMQRDAPPFDVVLFANGCTDRTVECALRTARAFAAFRFYVVEGRLPRNAAHVGTARKMLMDAAAARFRDAGLPRGIIATTDADTIVASDWVARTVEEMERVDAVGGCVEVRESDRLAMSASMRELYARELRHRELWAELESLIDPLPEDPLPRHSGFVGASIAVSARTYERAGGLPALPALEDRVFLASLRRIDARVRHSLRVRAWTSGRRRSRVPGGFATFINHLHERAPIDASYDVDDPRDVIRKLECRAALRRIWDGHGSAVDAEIVSATIGLAESDYLRLIDGGSTFGVFYERTVALAPHVAAPAFVPLEDALTVLASEIGSRRRSAPPNRVLHPVR